MTSHRNKRCVHCNTVYLFQSSGHGCLDQPNDDRYCPECMTIILKALSHVKRKYDSEWVESHDFTVAELVEIERKRLDEVSKSGGIPFRAFSMSLYDMSDFNNNNVTGIVHVDGKTYEYRYWTKKNEGEFTPKVSVLMQRDLVTKALEPWLDCR